MSETWLTTGAAELGRRIESNEIDPVDLTWTFLDAIAKHPLRDRIYARVTEDRAMAEARAAGTRARAGRRLSALDGVPVSWKDLFDTAGIATEAGSALLEGRVPDRDARVLQNASAAGLVCLGKTHMSELAFSGLGYNPVTATPPCINDLNAVPGGSSSGAAASVAFGLAAAAIGSDTGGSVRVPACWNDLVGLKTTWGVLSLEGVVPLAESFDTVGPLCRNVEDAAVMFGALQGAPRSSDLTGATLQGARLLIPTNPAFDSVDPRIKEAFEAAVEKLRSHGAQVERRRVEAIDSALKLSPVLFATEAYGIWKDVIEAAPDKMFGEILERFRAGARNSGPDLVQAWRQLEASRVVWSRDVAGNDAVILPTTPILPPKVDRLATDHEYYVSQNILSLNNTRVGNLMNLPALTLPTGVPSCGIMIITPSNTERRLLRLGAAAEAALA